MPQTIDQRRALGVFLRGRRERLQPSGTARRRTSGWRREEVAEAAGISTTWYTWIEQGRDISISAAALARLAATLRLSTAERAYLFDLARTRDPLPPAAGCDETEPSADLLRAVQITPAPAYLLDRLWRAVGSNPAARHLFAPWLDGDEPCLLRFVFLNLVARDLISDWEHRARRLLAEFRADTAQHPNDAALQGLIGDLCRESQDFQRFWNSQTVLGREGGERRFLHPIDGELRYQQITLIRPGSPDHKLVMLLPMPEFPGT